MENTIKKDDIWIIFGCSPFINTIKDKIPFLLKNFHSIGLNVFPASFKGCEYWLFNDSGIFTNLVKNTYAGEKLIVNKKLEPELKMHWYRTGQCVIKKDFVIKPHLIFQPVLTNPVIVENGTLLCIYSSVLPAINFAYLKRAAKVILAGIDLEPDWRHFYNEKPSYKNPAEIEKIKEKIYLFRDFVDLYKFNKNSGLDIDYLDINLLGENYG